jgi:hypothetical protein
MRAWIHEYEKKSLASHRLWGPLCEEKEECVRARDLPLHQRVLYTNHK